MLAGNVQGQGIMVMCTWGFGMVMPGAIGACCSGVVSKVGVRGNQGTSWAQAWPTFTATNSVLNLILFDLDSACQVFDELAARNLFLIFQKLFLWCDGIIA